MKAARLAGLLLALGIGAGCRKEPTIVIRFEPSDLGQPAAAHTVAVPSVAVPGAAPRAVLGCQTADDCGVVPVDCCDCAQGGKQEALSKKGIAAAQSARQARCKDMMCTMALSTDPSCTRKAACVEGKCVLR